MNIEIVERKEAINNIRQRTNVVVIQISEENHRPVAGAAVVVKAFAPRGPAGWFLKGKALKGVTDANGLIRTVPLKLDHLARLQVLASANGQHAALVISQAELLGVAPTAGGLSTATAATAGGAVAATGVSVSVPAVVAGAVSVGAASIGTTVAVDKTGANPVTPPTITIGVPAEPIFGPASLPSDPAAARAILTRSLGFMPGYRITPPRWFGGSVLKTHQSVVPTFWGYFVMNRYIRLSVAHISIGPRTGMSRSPTVGPRQIVPGRRER